MESLLSDPQLGSRQRGSSANSYLKSQGDRLDRLWRQASASLFWKQIDAALASIVLGTTHARSHLACLPCTLGAEQRCDPASSSTVCPSENLDGAILALALSTTSKIHYMTLKPCITAGQKRATPLHPTSLRQWWGRQQ